MHTHTHTHRTTNNQQVPLLKGLSDNDLLRVAGRMPERVYKDGEALITYGERGHEMYLIRYGKVSDGR